MSEESSELRRPTDAERALLLDLIRRASYALPADWFDTLFVQPMQDGGQGSLLLFEGARPPTRVFCKRLAECQFIDEDGIPVVAALNENTDKRPFELDMWKSDGSTLRRITTPFESVK
jgi:hypothetical protein